MRTSLAVVWLLAACGQPNTTTASQEEVDECERYVYAYCVSMFACFDKPAFRDQRDCEVTLADSLKRSGMTQASCKVNKEVVQAQNCTEFRARFD